MANLLSMPETVAGRGESESQADQSEGSSPEDN